VQASGALNGLQLRSLSRAITDVDVRLDGPKAAAAMLDALEGAKERGAEVC
jgi:hypothetical protein